MAASNAQVQVFVDSRIRQRAEFIRAAVVSVEDDRASLDDVYANLTNSPTWVDSRTDVPNKLTASDVLAINAFYDAIIALKANANYPVVLKGCVRPISQGFTQGF